MVLSAVGLAPHHAQTNGIYTIQSPAWRAEPATENHLFSPTPLLGLHAIRPPGMGHLARRSAECIACLANLRGHKHLPTFQMPHRLGQDRINFPKSISQTHGTQTNSAGILGGWLLNASAQLQFHPSCKKLHQHHGCARICMHYQCQVQLKC
jgi:hypothetical protein